MGLNEAIGSKMHRLRMVHEMVYTGICTYIKTKAQRKFAHMQEENHNNEA